MHPAKRVKYDIRGADSWSKNPWKFCSGIRVVRGSGIRATKLNRSNRVFFSVSFQHFRDSFFHYNFILENYSNLARLKNMIFNLLTSIYFNLVKWKSKSLILIKNRDSWFGGLCKNNEQNMRKEFWRAMVLIIDRRISSVS